MHPQSTLLTSIRPNDSISLCYLLVPKKKTMEECGILTKCHFNPFVIDIYVIITIIIAKCRPCVNVRKKIVSYQEL